MEEANETEVNTPYIPTEEEAAEALSNLTDEEPVEALASLPLQQDYITVPDGGLVFRTTTGRPLLHLYPLEDGTQLDIYGAEAGPDVQIQARLHGSVMHFVRQGVSAVSVSAHTGGGILIINQGNGTEGVSVSAGGAGGFVYVRDAAGVLRAGMEGTPLAGAETEEVDPALIQMMQPRPGEIKH